MFNCNRVHQPLRSKGSRWSMEALVPRSCSSSGWSDSAALPSRHIEDFVIWGRWDRTDWCCCVWSVGKISGTSSHLGFYSSCTIFSLGGNKPIKRSIMSVSGFVQSWIYDFRSFYYKKDASECLRTWRQLTFVPDAAFQRRGTEAAGGRRLSSPSFVWAKNIKEPVKFRDFVISKGVRLLPSQVHRLLPCLGVLILFSAVSNSPMLEAGATDSNWPSKPWVIM